MEIRKFELPQNEMPSSWYNVAADLPAPMEPPMHPGTHQPLAPEDLAAIFPMELIEQEMSTQRWIDIPGAVLDAYRLWRPTPLFRAVNLEKRLKTPAKIFFKYEGTSPAGSHKPNTAIAQAYYNKKAGVKKLTTETGAGQWGCALSFACHTFGLDCKVFMVKVSYNQKPYRKFMMQLWGGEVIASPSNTTESGRQILAKDPMSNGSLGGAISEAIEEAVKDENTKYSLGSVLNHVMLHQSIIGLEARKQMEMAGAYPDILIGCAGGGSNFAGLVFPFVPDKLAGRDIRIVAVEPSACPTLTRGFYRYDFGDVARFTPLLKMYTLGHSFMPPGIHAGGLRYHGMSPLVSLLYEHKVMEAVSYP
ncbi:MAG: TrpB-like pyridoxal phosphate-dependent enzyme, partial [bacterium]|nr:TrpB-like pyridoxal phosphate-dependent enzyme [bacterium]